MALLNVHTAQAEDVGTTVRRGEIDKEKAYEKNYDLPKGVKMVPFAVDAYGSR